MVAKKQIKEETKKSSSASVATSSSNTIQAKSGQKMNNN